MRAPIGSIAALLIYRFNSGQEPTDEMLAQIMREAAEDAKRSNEEATIKYFKSSEGVPKNNKLNGLIV